MEVLILLAAMLLAVAHALAFALNLEYGACVAKLARSYLHATLILILKGEFRRSDFNHDNLVVEVMV